MRGSVQRSRPGKKQWGQQSVEWREQANGYPQRHDDVARYLYLRCVFSHQGSNLAEHRHLKPTKYERCGCDEQNRAHGDEEGERIDPSPA